jgi:hypothetical protein
MDCKNVITRLAEIRRETKRAEAALGNGNSTRCAAVMDVIEAHLQAIRAELDSRRVRS